MSEQLQGRQLRSRLHRYFGDDPTVTDAQRRHGLARHVVAKLTNLTVGALVTSAPLAAITQVFNGTSPRPRSSRPSALVAHAYYIDLLGEIVGCLGNLPADADLIVTTPPEKADAARLALAGVARARVVPIGNVGRDIAPFIALLDAGELDGYDAVLKLHTKRSPHLLDGNIRRRLLFAMLAGSRRRVARVLALFEDPSTGLVGWRASWRASRLYWMKNKAHVAALAQAMDVAMPDDPAFFEGSMFWVRPAALRRLKGLGLALDRFEPEAGQTDGTLHHAIERVFTLAASADGFVVRDLAGRALLPAQPTPEAVRSAAP